MKNNKNNLSFMWIHEKNNHIYISYYCIFLDSPAYWPIGQNTIITPYRLYLNIFLFSSRIFRHPYFSISYLVLCTNIYYLINLRLFLNCSEKKFCFAIFHVLWYIIVLVYILFRIYHNAYLIFFVLKFMFRIYYNNNLILWNKIPILIEPWECHKHCYKL